MIEKETEKNQIQRDTVKTEALGGLCNNCSLPYRSSFSFALSPASQESSRQMEKSRFFSLSALWFLLSPARALTRWHHPSRNW